MGERVKKNEETAKMLDELDLFEIETQLEINKEGRIVFDLNDPEQRKSYEYWLDEN